MSTRERNRKNKKEIPSMIVIDWTFLLRFRFSAKTLYALCSNYCSVQYISHIIYVDKYIHFYLSFIVVAHCIELYTYIPAGSQIIQRERNALLRKFNELERLNWKFTRFSYINYKVDMSQSVSAKNRMRNIS